MMCFLSKLYESTRKRWRHLAFRLNSSGGQVRTEGKLWINVPLRCDGSGQVTIGHRVSIGFPPAPIIGDGMVRLQARSKNAAIKVGAGTSLSNNIQVIAEDSISIGERCLNGDGVLIMDSDAHNLSAAGRHDEAPLIAPVVIKDNVFVGSRVVILKGVTIGKDSVIGAGSVVIRSIPPASLPPVILLK